MSNARNLARLLPNASGRLPVSNMGAGTIVGVDSAWSNSGGTISSTSYSQINPQLSYTPKLTSSNISLHVSLSLWGDVDNDTQGDVWQQFKVTTTQNGVETDRYVSTEDVLARGGQSRHNIISFNVNFAQTNGYPLTVKVYVRKSASSGGRGLVYNSLYSTIVLYEVST